jgi:hypothetical protein
MPYCQKILLSDRCVNVSQARPSVTGCGNLVWVGVLRVIGIGPDKEK